METVIQSIPLQINLHETYLVNDFSIKVLSKIGFFNDIEYYQVIIKKNNENDENLNKEKLGLLRVGSVESGLKRELKLRQLLGEHKMVAELLAYQTSNDFLENNQPKKDSKSDVGFSPNLDIEDNSSLNTATNEIPEPILKSSESENINKTKTNSPNLEIENELDDQQQESAQEKSELPPTQKVIEDQYLEEEYYDPEPIIKEEKQLLILTELPNSTETLTAWINNNESCRESLLLVSQLTQFFRQVIEQKWCFVSLFPELIKQGQNGNPIQFFDLTTVYPLGIELETGFIGDYYPPEIAMGKEINEKMSTYVTGTVLYQVLHHRLPPRNNDYLLDLEQNLDLDIKKIPVIHQIINISLSPIPENRFPLSQLLNLLISIRKYFETPKIRWEISSDSTVGLSTHRLKNEDNFGILQSFASQEQPFVLAIVADGMGGMAQGEIASKTAVQTILNSSIPNDLKTPEKCNQWLTALVSEANKMVCEKVKNGGTTLSLAMAIAQKLYIAQVGDSRIFLLRKGRICQLSEDHSVVAMLLATEQITYEESQNHPDKNMLTKSLGSNPILPHNYVQNLGRFGGESWLDLENEDIILLCSDGVWDLANQEQLVENFANQENLHLAVTTTIKQVITKGAHDNATLVALKCYIENNHF